MEKKVCLVTGANGGIGKETSLAFAKLGYKVLMVCRDKEKGEEARKKVISESENKDIDLLIGDLGSFKSIRRLAKTVNSKYRKLDILVNNAGIFFSDLGYTEDKIERQFQINYLSPFLLTNLLEKALERSGHAKVLNVASHAHERVKGINFGDIYLKKHYNGLIAYSQSKLAVVMSTFELAKRWKDKNIRVNCLHPGKISSNIATKHASGIYTWIWKIAKPFFSSPEKAAEAIVYITTSKETENVTGEYFVKKKVRKSSKESHNQESIDKLWKLSRKLAKLPTERLSKNRDL